MNQWNKIYKPIVVLCVICVIITGALAATNGITASLIEQTAQEIRETARKELVPDAKSFTPVEGIAVENVSDIYLSDTGYAVITCSAKGYGGPITVMVAFDAEGTVERIKITEQTETQGLGSKIVTDPDFQASFSGLPAEPFHVTDIDAISGATISSKAVTAAVNAAIVAYNQIV